MQITSSVIKKQNCLAAIASLLLLSVISIGCTTPTSDENVFYESDMDFGSLRTIAVLPFQNLSGDDDGPERVRDTFIGMLLATEAVYVLPAGEVARGIDRIGRFDPQGPSSEQIRKLSGILGVDAFVTGVLREYGTVRSGATSANVVSLSLQMVEVESGTVVWSASSTKGGITMKNRLFGGGGEPMNTVTEQVINDLLEKLFP